MFTPCLLKITFPCIRDCKSTAVGATTVVGCTDIQIPHSTKYQYCKGFAALVEASIYSTIAWLRQLIAVGNVLQTAS